MNFLSALLLALFGCLSLNISRPGMEASVPTDSDTRSIQLPFEFYHNEVLVRVRINGKGPFTMLLDTDTDPSTISLSTARALGLKLENIPGQENLFSIKMERLTVGAVEARDVDALALDLSKFSQALKRPIEGVLGNSFLANRIVQIDYPKRLIRFFKTSANYEARRPRSIERVVIPFKYDDDDGCMLIDDVSVNGKKVTAALDTGSDGSFKLTSKAAGELGIGDQAEKGPSEHSLGYTGELRITKGKLGTVTIGSIKIDSPAVVFFGKESGRDKKPWGLNIGNVFFKDFVVTFDYQRKVVVFERP